MNSKKEKNEKSVETKKHIHVILSPNRIKKFNVLKKEFEQNSDVDVLRICIDKVYESSGSNNVLLKQILSDQIDLILKNDYFRGKYLLVESENDIINDAVNLWLQSKKHELNLHNVPFRN